MKTVILNLVVASMLLLISENSKLSKKVNNLQNRLDFLCEKTENLELSSKYISQELKQNLIELKKQQNQVKVVKMLRQNTSLSLLEAKQYIDKLE